MKLFILLLITLTVLYLVALIAVWYFQEKFIFLPEKLSRNFEFSFKHPYKELFITTKDAILNALYFPHPSSKGVIFYLHGNAGSMRTWAEVSDIFLSRGYSFFIFDYRGYGKSTGKLSKKNLYRDASLMYEYASRLEPGNKMIIYGRSLGSGFAAKLAIQKKPEKLILETPYYSMEEMARLQMPFFPVKLILKYKLPSYKWIPKIQCPILAIHGTEDELIPYNQAVRLKQYLKASDRFVTIEKGMHGNISTFRLYHTSLDAFLNNENT
jgi:pimeloyl-ACP methyl ester carboxylesterase